MGPTAAITVYVRAYRHWPSNLVILRREVAVINVTTAAFMSAVNSPATGAIVQ